MAQHICHIHYDEKLDLSRCGIDIYIITHQYAPVLLRQ